MMIFTKFAAARWALSCTALLLAPGAHADRTIDEAFVGAPPEINAFLIEAEAADRIVDPLARCQAFPDLPGNQWPAGLAQAHCELNFGPRVGLPEVKALLDRGAVEELDARLSTDLERHFSATDFSEAIHSDFDAFDDGYESGRLTKLWLDQAPDSAYALAARAVYYRNMASTARGTKWIRDTPRENVIRMREFSTISADLYRRAIEVEPRLLPAYVGLLDLGMMTSDDVTKQWAVETAKRIDPACRSVTDFQMSSLEPRWGGSYPEMRALADEIAPFVSRRPLLALNTIWPAVDLANTLYRSDRYADVIETLKPVLLQSSHPEAFEFMALAMQESKADRWWTLVYFLEASRFRQGRTLVTRSLGQSILWYTKKPAWALRYLQQASNSSPDDAYVHYLVGAAHAAMMDPSKAAIEFRMAAEDMTTGNLRRDSLHEMAAAFITAKQFRPALEAIEPLNHDFPEYAWGWRDRAYALNGLGESGVLDALKTFLELVDTKDPDAQSYVVEAERIITQFETSVRANEK